MTGSNLTTASPGRLLSLPAQGRAIIIADLHGHWGDFTAVVRHTRVLERIAQGEDLYLIITGDICDLQRHRAIDPDVPATGDIKILDYLIEMRASLGARGHRIVYLEGNHDFNVLRIFHELECFGGSLPEYLQYYLEQYGEFFFQNNIGPYDIITRIEKRHLEFIASGPLVVRIGNGIVITHAGPVRKRWGRDLSTFIAQQERAKVYRLDNTKLRASVYFQLLNNRYILQDYTAQDLKYFLRQLKAQILITGHTPLSYFLEPDGRLARHCEFYHGMILVAGRQVVLASSYGAWEGLKLYLDLDLSRCYTSPRQWQWGAEICPVNNGAAS